MRLMAAVGLWCVAGLISGSVQAATFTLDKQHTEVRFSWDHMGVSRQSGRAGDVTGTLQFDPEHPQEASVVIEIKVASLSTGVPALDAVLIRGHDYLDGGVHKTIVFKSTSVHLTGDKTADVAGNLAINGIERPVSLAVHWNYLGPHPLGGSNPTFQNQIIAGFSARTQILRSEWQIARMIPLVSDEIRIAIESEWRAEAATP